LSEMVIGFPANIRLGNRGLFKVSPLKPENSQSFRVFTTFDGLP